MKKKHDWAELAKAHIITLAAASLAAMVLWGALLIFGIAAPWLGVWLGMLAARYTLGTLFGK